jgi:hypothetical protein
MRLLAVGAALATLQPYAAALLQITLTMQAADIAIGLWAGGSGGLFDASVVSV